MQNRNFQVNGKLFVSVQYQKLPTDRAEGLLSDIDSSDLSKVYEKQVLHQLTDFIETKQVYYTHQCGYCKSHSCLKDLEKDLTPIAKWSIETNLVFSTGKTKFMLITLIQLSAWHKRKEDEQLQICCNNTELERVTEWKLLGFTIDQNLTLNNHISKMLKITNDTHRSLYANSRIINIFKIGPL